MAIFHTSEYYIEQAIGYSDRNILEKNTRESETEADLLMRQ